MKTLLGEIKLPPPPKIDFPEDGGRVLIVEDETDVMQYMEILLREYGLETMGVADARDCIGAAESFRPDVICLDIVMPQRTGISIYANLRQRPALAQIPVIIVSGLSRTGDFAGMTFVNTARDLGLRQPEDWMEKPFDKKQFVKAVAKTIGRSRAGIMR